MHVKGTAGPENFLSGGNGLPCDIDRFKADYKTGRANETNRVRRILIEAFLEKRENVVLSNSYIDGIRPFPGRIFY